MVGQNYRGISRREQLFERVQKTVDQTGLYNSVFEFASETLRCRVDIFAKDIKNNR